MLIRILLSGLQYNFLPLKMLIVDHDGSRYEQIVTRLDLEP